MPNRIRHALNATTLLTTITLTLVFATVTGAYAANNTPSTLDAFAGTGAGTGVGALAVPLANPPAGALTRIHQSSFGSFSFGDPQALTADQATGDVYAVSPSAGTVSRYTSTGAADNFTAGSDNGTNTLTGFSFDGPSAAEVAVAPAGAAGGTAGDIYVVSFAGVDIYANDGTHLGQITQANGSGFEESCGVATDNTGNLYIGDFAGKIDRYSPSANPITNTDYDAQITGVSSPCNIAVDSTGVVYASTWSTGPLTKHPATDFGTSNPGTLIDTSSRAVSVDPSTDDVYVDEGEKIAVFDSTGAPLYTFGSSSDFGTNSAGIAVQGSAGNSYVADSTNKEIDVYGPTAAVPPTATTGTASDIHHVKATLNGHLDPNGGAEITDCHFDWGTTNTYGNTTPCTQGNNYSAPADVSAAITGLEPAKTYHYRLVVAAGTSTGTGDDQVFEAAPIPVAHTFASSFGPEPQEHGGPGTGSFSTVQSVAVDQATGDVYVYDTGVGSIYKFSATGEPIEFSGPKSYEIKGIEGRKLGEEEIAVSSAGATAGDIYVAHGTSTILIFDAAGEPIGEITGANAPESGDETCGVAVDTTGNVYMSRVHGFVDKYAPTSGTASDADYVSSLYGLKTFGEICSIAVDSQGAVYADTWQHGPVTKYAGSQFNTEGRPAVSSPANGAFDQVGYGLAADPFNNHVYVDELTDIAEFTSTGDLLDRFAEGAIGGSYGLAVNGTSGQAGSGDVYVADNDTNTIKIFGPVTPPSVTNGTATEASTTSAILTATISSNGVPVTDCHFEYVSDAAFLATGFTNLSSGGTAPCSPDAGSIPADLEDHTITATITGLDPATIYHYRLLAANAQITVDTQDANVPGPPLVETTGSPTRTTTTARLDSRIDPRGEPATYHFEYGDQGPCNSNPCTITPTQSAGNSDTFELVSQQVTNLKANTTYHYRIVAENGNTGGTANGADHTLTTRNSDAPLTHGHFPGPPGSDRAWEQVNIPDTGGNRVKSLTISNNGERAVYSIDGGSPGSTYGGETFGRSNEQFAERTPDGWQRRDLYPTRAQAQGNSWVGPWGSTDLSELYALNSDETHTGTDDLFRMAPGAPAQDLYDAAPTAVALGSDSFYTASDDGSRLVGVLIGTNDPAYPLEQNQEELYDLSSGNPKLVGLLPGNSLPSCGVNSTYIKSGGGGVPPSRHWLTPDGSHVFFNTYPGSTCAGQTSLYDRDLVSSTTTLIASKAIFVRSAAGAVFFITAENLIPSDASGNDIYRYQINDDSVRCLTCSIPGGAEIRADLNSVVVSDDGSRVYFRSSRRVLAGAASDGIYRLDVSNGNLGYVAPDFGVPVSEDPSFGNALSPDGSVFVFRSSSPELNAIDGQQNGGTAQYYRYDDRDRSLVCASCPADGSFPRDAVGEAIFVYGHEGANISPLTSDGDFFFVTPTPLYPADQNTAPSGQDPLNGDDLYEWRDGRLLLVTDGKTETKLGEYPEFAGVSADGRNVFFNQWAALTPDAIDSVQRLYDARVGGGFEFPPAPVPCSLEACQGIASPPPSDGTPASLSFSGPGNQVNKEVSPKLCGGGKCVKSHQQKRCVKGKVLKHGKCVKKLKRKRVKRTTRNHGGAK
jgi:hypothetical protein